MRRAPGWLGLVVLAGVAFASAGADYQTQWPLAVPDGNAGMYRVSLDAGVYATARSPWLDDVDIVDARGQPVAAQLFAPERPGAAAPERVPAPWFALPAATVGAPADLALAVERAGDGSVLRVQAQASAATAAAPVATGWLVDASAVEASIAALVVDWTGARDPFEAAYRIEGSDDLREWRVLQPRVVLLDLARGGQRLRQPRVPVEASARYLRLVPLTGAEGLVLTRVEAELAVGSAPSPAPQWRELDAQPSGGTARTEFVYLLDGRFPVDHVDLALPGSGTGEWTLYSRESSDAAWVRRAGPWVAYSIGRDQRSPPQRLAAAVRDRHWRLVAADTQAAAPVLRLGWHPEMLVFVAGDAPPYRLVAGSARTSRAGSPVAQSLAAIRTTRGEDWQPPRATLGPPAPLAGEAALRPARDWRAWLLWSLLVAGALLVAWFSASLLRTPRT
ncbi:DUF3999 domain-containing protein [Luteimonas kalidii]|uniref:DUF3999 domain-containing protein n=1 Tax=Luteimonas kalidii TaxID=3042025 RepID=A0ABT6JV77_9GAMM|nr:DUF3999 domain-containing protein [Luteimonas kalidii]MDH5834577.1 DUF3999 domain-containing protein [Luteimonas kalidii]